MAAKPLKVGSLVRLTSFADKPADGSEPKGYSASLEDAPDEDKKVFICMLMAIEPLLHETAEDHDQQLMDRVLNSMGYYKVFAQPGVGQA